MRKKRTLLNIILTILTISSTVSAEGIFNHSKFNDLLGIYVRADGKVDYKKFAISEEFESYLNEIGGANLSGFNSTEKLAFYINVYNALVIKNVINNYPINSPLEVEGFFTKNKFTVAGERLTLDELEHERIGKIEPVLMHFGLVCAAQSCPKLIQKIYDTENVYVQLNANAKLFLTDTTKNLIDYKNKTLYLSEIFKWFKPSFEMKYGTINKAIAVLSGQKDPNEFDSYNFEFKKYNWELNSQ